MHETELTALIAVQEPSGEHREHRNDTLTMIDELCVLSEKITFALDVFDHVAPSIQRVPKINALKPYKRFFRKLPDHTEVIQISAVVRFLGNEVTIEGGDLTELHKIEMYRLRISSVFQQQVSNLLVAANLSRPASVEVQHVAMFQDARETECSIPQVDAYILQRAIKHSVKAGWPKLREMKFVKAWNWLNEITDFSERGFAETQMGRALCAFSRMLEPSEHNEPIHLLWSLVGLEALYGQGKVANIEQLKDKTKLLLGQPLEFTKAIAKMYEFRKRFIHGALDFPSFSFKAVACEEEQYFNELVESMSVAAAVLTATLQTMIQRQWRSLAFSYKAHDGGTSE